MFAAVLVDFGRPLPTIRIELPVASIFLKRLSTPLLDHLLDGNSLNNLLELHFFLFANFQLKFCRLSLFYPLFTLFSVTDVMHYDIRGIANN